MLAYTFTFENNYNTVTSAPCKHFGNVDSGNEIANECSRILLRSASRSRIYVVNVYARQTGKNPNKLFEFGAKILLQGK